jgi:hypothetical protein
MLLWNMKAADGYDGKLGDISVGEYGSDTCTSVVDIQA